MWLAIVSASTNRIHFLYGQWQIVHSFQSLYISACFGESQESILSEQNGLGNVILKTRIIPDETVELSDPWIKSPRVSISTRSTRNLVDFCLQFFLFELRLLLHSCPNLLSLLLIRKCLVSPTRPIVQIY